MSDFPEELRYSKTHEWVRIDEDNTITVGITDHAQSLLGDLVFVELPEINTTINQGDEVAVVESVKTAADVYTPIAGKIIAINENLSATPDAVNNDPYGKGWLFRIKTDDVEQLKKLLNAKAYQTAVKKGR